MGITRGPLSAPVPQVNDGPLLTQSLRDAIDASQMEGLLKQAGAAAINAGAADVLRETAAATVARRMGKAVAGQDWPVPAPPVTPELLDSARAAVGLSAVEAAVASSAAAGTLRPETVHQALALELGAIAGQAARFAIEEKRPVCPNCVAIGAARSAEDGSTFISLQLPSFASSPAPVGVGA